MIERLQQIQAGNLPNGLSFKDVLVQLANMQQNNLMPTRPMETMTNRPEHHIRPESRRRQERNEDHMTAKQAERMAASSPRLPPPPPYPEISLLPVTSSQEIAQSQQNSLLHGILTKVFHIATHAYGNILILGYVIHSLLVSSHFAKFQLNSVHKVLPFHKGLLAYDGDGLVRIFFKKIV